MTQKMKFKKVNKYDSESIANILLISTLSQVGLLFYIMNIIDPRFAFEPISIYFGSILLIGLLFFFGSVKTHYEEI